MKKLISMLLALAMVFTLAACSQSGEKTPSGPTSPAPGTSESDAPSTGDEVIVPVGAVLSTTGAGASVGINVKNGIEYAIEVVNNKGGLVIDGVTYKFKLIHYDDGAVAADAVSAAQRLVVEDGVTNFIFGSTTSTTTLACLEVLETAKVPIMTVTSNPSITNDYVYGWRNKTSTTDQGRLMTQYFHDEMDCQTMAVIANNDDWGRAGAEDVAALWEAAGGEVVSIQYIDPSSTDFTTELTNVKALNPDFVYEISLKAAGSIVAKQFDEMGIDAYYATVDDVMCEYTVGDYLYWHDSGYTDEMKEINEAITAKGQECTVFAMFGYDGFMMVYQAMEEAQNVYDSDAIMEALYACQGSKYTSMGKNFLWDENGQVKMDIYLVQQTDASGAYEGVWCSPASGEGYKP